MEGIKDKNKKVIEFLENIMYKTTEDATEEAFNNWMRELIKEIKEGKMRCQA